MGVADDIRAMRKDGAEFPVDISLSTLETLKGTFVVSGLARRDPQVEAEKTARQHARVSAVVDDRERLGRGLLQGVIHQLFQVGMGLQATASSIENDELRSRVMDRVRELDDAITSVREFVFDATSTIEER